MNETYNLLISKDYLNNQNLGKGKNVTFFVPNSNYLTTITALVKKSMVRMYLSICCWEMADETRL